MPHVRDVVDDVEIRTPQIVVQVLHRTAHDRERLAVRDAERRANALAALGQERLARLWPRRAASFGQSEDEVGIGRQ